MASKDGTGLVEAHPCEQHALDTVPRVPQLDLIEVENVGHLAVSRYFIVAQLGVPRTLAKPFSAAGFQITDLSTYSP